MVLKTFIPFKLLPILLRPAEGVAPAGGNEEAETQKNGPDAEEGHAENDTERGDGDGTKGDLIDPLRDVLRADAGEDGGGDGQQNEEGREDEEESGKFAPVNAVPDHHGVIRVLLFSTEDVLRVSWGIVNEKNE